jgi:hypothetical protein
MAMRTYLQGLGATHLFDLDNNGTLTTDDLGDSVDPTNIIGGTYTFATDPVCESVTHSLDVVASTSDGIDGAIFENRRDINNGPGGNGTSTYNYVSGTRSLLIWYKQAAIQNATCIYEQGGGTNNFAFMGGALITFQAADAGEPFLIIQSLSLTQANRPYCLVGVWEHHSQHAGSGNRVILYVNGIAQGTFEDTGTANFPNHTGDITCGNSSENLKSFAETNLTSQTTDKNCNYLGMFNNVSLTQAQAREIFERSTFADVTIVADTVANMQTALDALSGNTYENTNCAIRILQATDATNFRLFIDNITFNADSNLEDISIQFVGTGILTVEDTNGTVIQYTSTPPEVETTSTTYTGGGSIVVVNNTKRVTTDQTITNPQDDKIVFDGSGSNYTIDGGIVPVIENVSGNTVTVSLINGAPTPTLLSFIVEQSVNITAPNIIDGSRVQIYNVTKGAELDNSVVSSGSGYSSTANLADASIDAGDTIRIRAEYISGTDARDSLEAFGVVTTTGLSYLDSQVNDAVYNAISIDGSAVTGYSADYVDDEIDIAVPSEFNLKEMYAWWVFNKSTSQGVNDFAGGIIAESTADFKVVTSIVNIFLDNTTTNWIIQSDDARFYRDDNAYPIKRPTTGGGCIDVEWRRTVSLAQSTEITEIKATVDANLDATVSSRATQTSVDNIPTNVPTTTEIKDAIFDEIV